MGKSHFMARKPRRFSILRFSILAALQYAGALKLGLFGALLVGVLVPRALLAPWLSLAALLFGIGAIAVLVGLTESVMARLRLRRVPQLLVVAAMFAAVGVILVLR